MLNSDELKDYWQPKLIQNLDEGKGSELVIGTLMQMHLRAFDDRPGTTFDSGSVILSERSLCVDGHHNQVHQVVEFPWIEIASITFVHKWPSEHSRSMKAQAAGNTMVSFRSGLKTQ
jgi:hypothetical protein